MSHLWQAFAPVFGRLSVTSCLPFLFLYSSVALRVFPSNPVSLDSAIMQTEKPKTHHNVRLSFIPVQFFSHKFQGPKAVGEVRTKSGKKSKHEQP